MRKSSLFLVCLLLAQAARASLITVSGTVSGTWSADTVRVVGDATVPTGQTLTIQPGVEVQFTGQFMLLVQGRLNAVGTVADTILFTRAFPTEESKWSGLRLDGADNASLLEYCRVEWAKRTGAYPGVHGGCVWINNCSPTVRHCLLANSYSHNANYNGMGAGICVDQNSNSLIEYNDIILNQADSGGGICVGSGCNPVIRHNVIESNQGFYAGGGIYVSANGRSTIRDNVIRNNTTAGYGGGGINLWSASWLYGTTSDVSNNLITGNSATSAGGGIYSRYDSSQVHNNTIVANQAPTGAGVYVLTFSYLLPTLSSNIIWNNTGTTGPQIYLDPQSGSAANVFYCDVQGGWAGIGNLNADPLFVAGPDGGYYLSQIAAGQAVNSPCVNAGDPLAAMITGTTRTDRVQDAGIVDMGYHYDTATAPPSNLDISLAPWQPPPPIIIPPTGGSFSYVATVTNNGATPVSFNAWIKVQLPHGSWYGPVIGPLSVNLGAQQSVTRFRLQSVPGSAPPGLYTYRGWVGTYPFAPVDSSSFTFTKQGVRDWGLGVGDWSCTGESFPNEEVSFILQPTAFSLIEASPNPFNSMTTISFELPSASHVTLKIYDASGRLTATLIDGWREAGNHQVIFDGTRLSSGVYLYDLTADFNHAAGKLLLLK